jgi:hypothetical protein
LLGGEYLAGIRSAKIGCPTAAEERIVFTSVTFVNHASEASQPNYRIIIAPRERCKFSSVHNLNIRALSGLMVNRSGHDLIFDS